MTAVRSLLRLAQLMHDAATKIQVGGGGGAARVSAAGRRGGTAEHPDGEQ
jgi:hypothetical protein